MLLRHFLLCFSWIAAVPCMQALGEFPNVIKNGDFGDWKTYTGEGLTVTDGGVPRDRFLEYWYGGPGIGATAVYDVVDFDKGQSEVPGSPKRHLRITWKVAPTSGETQHGSAFRSTFLEYFGLQDVRMFSGHTVLVSFYARIVSPDTSSTLDVVPIMWHSYDPPNAEKGIGYQLFESSGDPGKVCVAQGTPNPGAVCTLTTAWQRFEKPITLPDVSGKRITAGHYTGLGFDMISPVAPTIDIANVEARDSALPAAVRQFYVSNSGNDAHAGTAGAPFATLARARDALRETKAHGPRAAVVWIDRGTYPLAESFTLTADDSGSGDAPIVYRAMDDQPARVIGGRSLSPSVFLPVTDEAIRKRIDPSAREHVLRADLHALGIDDCGTMPDHFEAAPAVSELFFDGARMTLAQWPNEGWAEIDKVIESGPAPWRNYESGKLGVFQYSGDRPGRWLTAPAVWLQGYWCFDWAIDSIKVKTIDTATKQITLAQQHHYGIGSGNAAPRRYKAFNLLEELDRPGEYFIDRDSRLLYFWPPAGLGSQSIVLTMLRDPVVAMNGASNVTLRGLTVEMGAGNAVNVNGGRNVTIAGCTLRNIGLSAVDVNGGERHAVVACDIYNTGTNGIQMSGGDRKALVPSRHEIRNNDIYNVSLRQPTHAYNLSLGGVGIRVAHNRIHDAPHQAITIGGNDHLIEYNEVYNIGRESDDCGAFYMGRNPSERGTVLQYNFWHDIGSTMALGSTAIYFDDGAGGQRVFGNIFVRAAGGTFGAVFSHGGHDNWVENNIFFECKRAMGAAPWSDATWQQWLGEPLWRERLLKEVDITRPPYSERYPELAGFMDSWKRPRLNHASRNVIAKCDTSIVGNWDVGDTLVFDGDPGFVDAAKNDYSLSEDSIVLKTLPDFRAIPFAEIGLQSGEYRPKK